MVIGASVVEILPKSLAHGNLRILYHLFCAFSALDELELIAAKIIEKATEYLPQVNNIRSERPLKTHSVVNIANICKYRFNIKVQTYLGVACQ